MGTKFREMLFKARALLPLLSVLATIGTALFIKSQLAAGIRRFDQELLGREGTPAEITLESGENQAVYESPIFKAEVQFNALAPHWEEENAPEGARAVFWRFSSDGKRWGEWLEVEGDRMRDDDPNPQAIFPEFPFLIEGRFFQSKVELKREDAAAEAPKIRHLKATYINSKNPPLRQALDKVRVIIAQGSRLSTKAADQGPSIISRAGWGNPDPYGQLFRGTDQWWAPAYAPVAQIFLHHTVFNNTSDPAAAVRAIWEYHTYTRGWGDIGYNYLVDRNGTIYEGRAGGENVVGGHVYTYNRGSVGVAVLGCFETNSRACSGAPPPSPQMLGGLTTLLAWKSTNYEINPNTTQTFCGTSSCLNLWTISGHKDASVTSCPGNLISNQFQTIREQTWNKKNTWQYSAKQLDFDPASFNSYSTEKSVTIRFKNTGTATWINTGNRLILKTTNPNGRTSIFQGLGWIDAQTPATLNEASVAPGETGSFTFNLQSPANSHGYYFEGFRLVLEDGTTFPQSFGVVILPPSYRWEFRGVSHSTNSVFMNLGESQTINLWAKNTGTATWYRDTGWTVRLGTWGPGRESPFKSGSWFNSIRPAKLLEESVAPGETGTFAFTVFVYPTAASGWYYERLNLVAEGLVWFNDTGAGAYFNVLPSSYQWQFMGVAHSTNSVFMNPGETQTITLWAKNTGSTTWRRDTGWPVRLGTWGPTRPSSFYHSSWFNNVRPALLNQVSVAPGETGTFTFEVSAPLPSGWYFERFNLVAEGLIWFSDSGAGAYFFVNP